MRSHDKYLNVCKLYKFTYGHTSPAPLQTSNGHHINFSDINNSQTYQFNNMSVIRNYTLSFTKVKMTKFGITERCHYTHKQRIAGYHVIWNLPGLLNAMRQYTDKILIHVGFHVNDCI